VSINNKAIEGSEEQVFWVVKFLETDFNPGN